MGTSAGSARAGAPRTGSGDHAHSDAMALGPIDVPRWGAAAVGVLLGLVVVLALIQSLS